MTNGERCTWELGRDKSVEKYKKSGETRDRDLAFKKKRKKN